MRISDWSSDVCSSNMPKGLPSISSRTRLTMMLGEVTTSVISPPSSAANDIGLRKTEGGGLFFFAIWNAEGISIASAPTFLTSPDEKPTEELGRESCRARVWKYG